MGGLAGNARRRAFAAGEKAKGRLTGIANRTGQLDGTPVACRSRSDRFGAADGENQHLLRLPRPEEAMDGRRGGWPSMETNQNPIRSPSRKTRWSFPSRPVFAIPVTTPNPLLATFEFGLLK